MDVFFVISGFVITKLLLREASKGLGTGLADFYSRRVRRILPAASVTLVGTLVAAAVLLGSRTNPKLPGDVRWASLFSANFRLIETGSNYFVPGLFPSLVTQFWSLAVEEQFYLVFPLVVFVVARAAPADRRRDALAAALAVGVAASAWWSLHISAAQPTVAYYSPLTRFWELGLGCLLAVLNSGPPGRRARSGRVATAAGVGLLVIGLWSIDASSVYPGGLAWLPCGGTALLLWAGTARQPTAVGAALAWRPITYIGDISYSLYLTHYVWLQLPRQLSHPLTSPGWRLVELAGTLVTAVLSYHLLENPLRRSRRLAGDRVATVLVFGVCVAASWTAATIVGRLIIP